jgi:hypothetical protein
MIGRAHARRVAVALLAATAATAACSRTGLYGPDEGLELGLRDAAIAPDAPLTRDATLDGDAHDAHDVDAPEAGPLCPAYVITLDSQFAVFYPDSGLFAEGHALQCATLPGAQARTMAVNSKAQAFILYDDGYIYQVDPRTYACTKTIYEPQPHGVSGTFGMAFRNGAAGEEFRAISNGTLYHYDPVTFRYVSQLSVSDTTLLISDLQATPDGRLFAFDTYRIDEIDPNTGSTLSTKATPGVPHGAWTFLAWNGDFILFDADPQSPGPTTVRRYHPADGTISFVTSYPSAINGADTPPCGLARDL